MSEDDLKTIRSAVTEELMPMLFDSIGELDIPEIDESVNAGKKLGVIRFGLDGFFIFFFYFFFYFFLIIHYYSSSD